MQQFPAARSDDSSLTQINRFWLNLNVLEVNLSMLVFGFIDFLLHIPLLEREPFSCAVK